MEGLSYPVRICTSAYCPVKEAVQMCQSQSVSADIYDVIKFSQEDHYARIFMQNLKEHHEYTYTHSIRVAYFALPIFREYHFAHAEQMILLRTMLLHDIGKIVIPQEVLNKRGPLNEKEWQLIHSHPELGANILALFRDSVNLQVVLQHHHNVDGSGYPLRVHKNDLPLAARIARVVDSYDAMTSFRGYNQPLTMQQAMAELHKYAGTYYDSGVVRTFCEYLNRTEAETNAVSEFVL